MIVLGLVVLLLGKKSRGATFPRVDPCLKDTKFFSDGFHYRLPGGRKGKVAKSGFSSK